MKKFLIIFLTLISVITSAQIYDPVNWDFTQHQISETEIELQFTAHIEKHWHLYSQHLPEGVDAYPTEFIFITKEGYQLVEDMVEPEPIREADPNFDNIILPYFEGEVSFSQKIKILTSNPFTIKGEINFMSCDESQCVFPMPVPFSFNINSDGSIQEVEEQEVVTSQDIENTEKYNDALVELNNPSSNCGEKKTHENTLWAIFILGLLGGLIALITPCVFPMIPLTVSFFTKAEKGKGMFNAVMYGFFIMLIYFLLSIPFHFFPNMKKHQVWQK